MEADEPVGSGLPAGPARLIEARRCRISGQPPVGLMLENEGDDVVMGGTSVPPPCGAPIVVLLLLREPQPRDRSQPPVPDVLMAAGVGASRPEGGGCGRRPGDTAVTNWELELACALQGSPPGMAAPEVNGTGETRAPARGSLAALTLRLSCAQLSRLPRLSRPAAELRGSPTPSSEYGRVGLSPPDSLSPSTTGGVWDAVIVETLRK